LFGGAFLYASAKKDRTMIEQYGVGTPNDWLEKNVYSRFPLLGITLVLLVNLLWFSYWGLLIWGIQMIWIPFWAAGVVNGIGHWAGYRNGSTKDHSRNISPIGIIIGGEELHNNHHLEPANAKLSRKTWEFDIGWMWLTVFRLFGLAKLKNA
jgi:stearoyl-CoA desaturase (delta-9 desaturase)